MKLKLAVKMNYTRYKVTIIINVNIQLKCYKYAEQNVINKNFEKCLMYMSEIEQQLNQQ